jgi:hypothetical protein
LGQCRFRLCNPIGQGSGAAAQRPAGHPQPWQETYLQGRTQKGGRLNF